MPSQPPVNPSTPPSRRERRELVRVSTPRVRSRAPQTKPPAWRSPIAIVSAAAVAVIVLVIVLTYKPGTTGNSGGLVPPPVSAAIALADGETLGRADAPVTVEIWADFQCPVCGTLVKDYMPRLATDFVIPGKVRIVAHDIAILGATAENESLSAAVGARCAGAQNKYWQFHDWLYYNQKGENKGAFSADRLRQIADQVGLDRAKWDACIADPAQSAAIRTNTSQAASQGITSTPSFRFGGQVVAGLPRAYADLASAIRKVLPSAAPAGTTAPSPVVSPVVSPAASPVATQ